MASIPGNGYQSPTRKDNFSQTISELNTIASSPQDEADRLSYGIIVKVDTRSQGVRIRRYASSGVLGDLMMEGKFLPLITPLSEIHLKYGALREGLHVRIHWKGKLHPSRALVEVIGEEDFVFMKKEDEELILEVGPYRTLSR